MTLPRNLHRYLIGFALGLLCVWPAAAQTTAPAAGEGKKIVAIEFEGLDSIKSENLLPLLKLKVGEAYSADAGRDDIRTLFSTGNFTDELKVQTVERDGGVAVVFHVRENPIINKIGVVGNQKIPSDRIVGALPVREGQIFKNQTAREVQEAVYKLYRAKGYSQTQVIVNPTDVTNFSVNLQILVNEGTKIEVDKVVIRGNSAFGNSRLKWQMNTKGSWGPFDNYYDETAFQDDLKTLEQFYQQRGYFDVRAQRGQFVYNESKGTVTPVVEIDEGVQYKVGTIEARGVTLFNQINLLIFFDSLHGRAFKAASFQKAVEKVRKLYADEGYLLTEITPKPTLKPEIGEVDFTLEVNEKTRVYVGEVKVEKTPIPRDAKPGIFDRFYGRISPEVKEEVIRREARLKSGEVYREYLEVRTVERLRNLEIFDRVEAYSEPTDREDVRNMVIKAKEGITGNVAAGVGFGDASGAFVFGSYTERNLFGDARDLRVQASLGTRITNISVSYLDRYFRGTETSMEANLFRTSFQRTGYDETHTGTSVEFGKPINEFLREYLRFRLEYVNLDKNDDDIEEHLGSYPVATIRGRYVLDTRDDNLWPTKGYRAGAGLEVGAADGLLVKFTGEYSRYWKVYRDWVYALNVEAGLLPYDASQIGLSERFFMGGSADLRGFKFRGAGPKLLVQNELRFPLYDNLSGLFFVDAGMLDRSGFSLSSPRASAGFGLRYNVRYVDVALDFAGAFLKQSGDDTQFVHFRLGSLF